MDRPITSGYWFVQPGWENIIWNQNGISEIMKGRGKHVEFRPDEVLFFDNGIIRESVPRKNKYDVLLCCECFADFCEFGLGSLISKKEIRGLVEYFY